MLHQVEEYSFRRSSLLMLHQVEESVTNAAIIHHPESSAMWIWEASFVYQAESSENDLVELN